MKEITESERNDVNESLAGCSIFLRGLVHELENYAEIVEVKDEKKGEKLAALVVALRYVAEDVFRCQGIVDGWEE